MTRIARAPASPFCILAIVLLLIAASCDPPPPSEPAATPAASSAPPVGEQADAGATLSASSIDQETPQIESSRSDTASYGSARESRDATLTAPNSQDTELDGGLRAIDEEGYRIWSYRGGLYKWDAKLIDINGIHALLERRDGKQGNVNIEYLSDEDHVAIADWQRSRHLIPIDPVATVPVEQSNADMSLRNSDFPRTYIELIQVDLASPQHWVRLTWAEAEAGRQERGPFRSSPGRGLGGNNCDDFDESNRDGSNCTPKGEHTVEGFSDYLPTYPTCEFVTWFNKARQIAFHSHSQVPRYPASHGCVRLDEHAAQLIHNNARIGETKVVVDGTWSQW